MSWKPKTIKARHGQWDRAMMAALERHLAQAHTWGVSDCLIVPADICLAMTGTNPFPMKYRRYRTEKGAMKALLKRGYKDVEQALNAVFISCPLAHARRGDCGVVMSRILGKDVLSTVIVIGGGLAIGRGIDNQRITVPVLSLKSAFRVG